MKLMDSKCVNTLRVLGADIIAKAKSGHPGIVLGAAPIAHTLFTKHLNINPEDENWFNRDRFVLSAGHGSALLYMLLHFSGFNVSMDDLKQFRQKGSKTPGHPEYKHTHGVEITTGPLGQGIATAVGMAISEKFLHLKNTMKKPQSSPCGCLRICYGILTLSQIRPVVLATKFLCSAWSLL